MECLGFVGYSYTRIFSSRVRMILGVECECKDRSSQWQGYDRGGGWVTGGRKLLFTRTQTSAAHLNESSRCLGF